MVKQPTDVETPSRTENNPMEPRDEASTHALPREKLHTQPCNGLGFTPAKCQRQAVVRYSSNPQTI